MLFKLAGIIASIYILVQSTDIGKQQLRYAVNIVKIAVTQHELNQISTMIYKDLVVPNNYQLPNENNDWWHSYIRRNMRSKADRDTAADFWGTRYSVEDVYEVPGRGTEGFIVKSAGPDCMNETEDDIISAQSYR